MLLWLWCRLAATVLIRLLAWEPPYAMGVALKSKKKKDAWERWSDSRHSSRMSQADAAADLESGSGRVKGARTQWCHQLVRTTDLLLLLTQQHPLLLKQIHCDVIKRHRSLEGKMTPAKHQLLP